MVSNEEYAVYCAHDTSVLVRMLMKKERLILCAVSRGLCGDWIIEEAQRISVIKSELGRRGMLE